MVSISSQDYAALALANMKNFFTVFILPNKRLKDQCTKQVSCLTSFTPKTSDVSSVNAHTNQ